MDPGPCLLHTIYKLFTTLCLLSANYYFLPFDTFNPLFSAKPVRLTTSSQDGGKVLWLCCAGLHVATSTGSAPCQGLASNTFGVFPCSYWIDNLGFITEGKLASVDITPRQRRQKIVLMTHKYRGCIAVFSREVKPNLLIRHKGIQLIFISLNN